MFCSNCGNAITEGIKFCANCGTPVAQADAAAPDPTPHAPASDVTMVRPAAAPVTPPPVTPPPVTPPPVTPPPAAHAPYAQAPYAQPGAPIPQAAMPPGAVPPGAVPPPGAAAPSAGADAVGAALGAVGRWDWLGSARVALTLLVTSGFLALIVGIAGRPAIPHVHYTLHTSIAWLIWLWTSVFGGHLAGSANASLIGFAGAHASGSAAVWPLTLTVLTFAAGLWVFRRSTAGVTSALSMLGFVARTALLTALPLLIVSFFGHIGASDVLKLQGAADDFSELRHADGGLSAGASSAAAFFMTFLVVVVVLLLASLTRSDLDGSAYGRVRAYVSGAVRGAGYLLVALIPAGIIAEAAVWIFKPHGITGHISFHGAINIIAGCFAFAGNAGVAALSLGSLGKIGGSADTSVGLSESFHKGFWWLTGHGDYDRYGASADHGFYVVLILAPLVLIATAWMVSRGGDALARIGGWLVSLLVFLPLLLHFSGLRASGSASGHSLVRSTIEDCSDCDISGVPKSMSGHAFGGVPTSSMWLILLYAIVVAAIVALAVGAVSQEQLGKVRAGMAQLKPIQPTTDPNQQPAAPVVYQVGDVVNGHRFDGTRWIPLE